MVIVKLFSLTGCQCSFLFLSTHKQLKNDEIFPDNFFETRLEYQLIELL